MCKVLKYKLVIVCLLVLPAYYFSQSPAKEDKKPTLIKIISTKSLSYDKSRQDAKLLKGNVVCEHEGALLHCDSALIYEKENKMVAGGHVLITKGDSIRITGEHLEYEGKTKMATLLNNVRCTEKDMVLTTQIMTFDVGNSVANYYNGGTIVNKENTLTSKNGHYYSATKEAAFHYDVVLTNPDYKMNSDTLKYRISNKTSYFLGPSIILAKTDYIYCENGWYDTEKEKAAFSKNALLVTSQQKLSGDSLLYDRTNKIGTAYRNIKLIDTAQKSIIYGNYALYKEKKSEAFVTGKAVYARLLEKDTLFLAADTIYHLDIDSVDNLIKGFRHVRIFNQKIQGSCDSLSLNTKDSVMQLFYSPVLWANFSQATAKHMLVDIGKNNIKGFKMDGQAFLIQQVDSLNKQMYNQISAKTIKGLLKQDTVRKVMVSGNVEILYYPKDKNKLMGLNSTSCSDAILWFKKGDVDRVTLKPKTTGTLTPLREVDLINAKLKGFNWQYEARPKSKQDLHPGL